MPTNVVCLAALLDATKTSISVLVWCIARWLSQGASLGRWGYFSCRSFGRLAEEIHNLTRCDYVVSIATNGIAFTLLNYCIVFIREVQKTLHYRDRRQLLNQAYAEICFKQSTNVVKKPASLVVTHSRRNHVL